jgi:hypothetical protein
LAHRIIPDHVELSKVEHFNQVLDAEDESASEYLRYGLTKLANVLFAKELQRRFDEDFGGRAMALSVHPGNIHTRKLS